jgi:hypothetical protein
MQNTLKTHFRIWLVLGLAALALLTLAFQSGEDTDPAHCRSCKTPTRTPTATSTSTPPQLQSCRIEAIYFNEQLYSPGETITALLGHPLDITIKLVDHQGQLLIGANVDATVTQTDTVQAAAIPPLDDQSGTYDAVYIPENTGLYRFTFSASDFTGPRFLPCSAEALVLVEDDVTPTPSCGIILTSDQPNYTLGNTINLTANLSGTLCTSGVTATIRIPGDGIVTRQLTGPANICTGSYIPEITGTFAISATANLPQGTCTSNVITPIVTTPSPSTSTVRIDLEEPELDLCGRQNPDTASTVVATISNLAEVDLTITFDPTFIIPSKITPIFGPGTITQTNTTIRYTAKRSSPVSGTLDLLAIDWRLQGRDGVTTLALVSVLKDPNGITMPHTAQNGTLAVSISPPCLRCTVNLQGRSDHSRVTVTTSTGTTAPSYASGLFVLASTEPWRFTSPGYLSAEMNAASPQINSCRVNLLAGDVTGNNLIDILDLAYLAQHYQSPDPAADLNADGTVNILDMALVAGNYQRRGPLPGGQ